ncbi:MAG: OsmC family protein [Chloroflexi bacterium]|nr:OsmC family protein [Chloroflexota bacterium]OJV89544.1 MAG: hypothetical protein BGO39_36900 [Chloroflexi bacterium 54-19]
MASNGPGTSQEEFKWKARVSWVTGERSVAYSRNNSFLIEKQASFKEKDPHPSAIEYLLGALGGDIAAGFQTVAPRFGVSIEALEISLSGQLNNSLTMLGVIGEAGHPGLETIEGRIFISTEATEEKIEKVWQSVQDRSPLFNTLKRAVKLDFSLVIVL